jgi:uncharacterized protein
VQVRFDEIPEGGLRLNIVDNSWLPADEIKCQQPVSAKIFLDRDGPRVFLEGSLRVKVELTCDRCLGDFVLPIDTSFKVDFELVDQSDKMKISEDHACSDAEMDVVFLAEPLIDIFSILAQQLYLSLPDKRLCGDKCLGLCPGCGRNLNLDHCDCNKEKGTSPFSILAKLKE